MQPIYNTAFILCVRVGMPHLYEAMHCVFICCILVLAHHLGKSYAGNIACKLHILLALLLIQAFASSTVVVSRIVPRCTLLITMFKEQLILGFKYAIIKLEMLCH